MILLHSIIECIIQLFRSKRFFISAGLKIKLGYGNYRRKGKILLKGGTKKILLTYSPRKRENLEAPLFSEALSPLWLKNKFSLLIKNFYRTLIKSKGLMRLMKFRWHFLRAWRLIDVTKVKDWGLRFCAMPWSSPLLSLLLSVPLSLRQLMKKPRGFMNISDFSK